jgi:hypothetical protein
MLGIKLARTICSVATVDWRFVVPQSIAALTAGAATAGAIAAWRAARASERGAEASERTSRDALVALAIAIKPRINVDTIDIHAADSNRSVVLVQNISEWQAADVEVEIRLRSGQIVDAHATILEPSQTAVGLPTGADFEVQFGQPGPTETHASRLDRVLVRYSDLRRIRRYEYRQIWSHERTTDGSTTLVSEGMTREEDQIEGP